MACHRGGAPHPLGAEAVGEAVDQRCQAILDRHRQVGVDPHLTARHRLHIIGRQRHCLDPKAGIDGLQLGLEQPGDTAGIAARHRQADGQGQRLTVHPVEGDLEAPCTLAFRLQARAEFGGYVFSHPGHVFRRADRLDKGQASEPRRRRASEPQRLGSPAQGLIQTLQGARAEPATQRRAGDFHQLPQTAQA